MNLVYRALGWVAGGLLVLLGLMFIWEMPFAGLCFIVAGMCLVPRVRAYAYSVTNRTISTQAQAGVIAALIITGFTFIGIEAQGEARQKAVEAANAKQQLAKAAEVQRQKAAEFAANRQSIIQKAKADLAAEQYEQVIASLNQYGSINDAEAIAIQSTAKAELAARQKEAKQQELLAEVKKTSQSDLPRLQNLYTQLAQLAPENTQYQQQRDRYAQEIKAEEEKAAARVARKEQIEAQFSRLDGSHIQLARLIKKSMNDPDSYEHDDTTYSDKGDYLMVRTYFRGRNAFGGMVRNQVTAKVDLEGNVIEIISQN